MSKILQISVLLLVNLALGQLRAECGFTVVDDPLQLNGHAWQHLGGEYYPWGFSYATVSDADCEIISSVFTGANDVLSCSQRYARPEAHRWYCYDTGDFAAISGYPYVEAANIIYTYRRKSTGQTWTHNASVVLLIDGQTTPPR